VRLFLATAACAALIGASAWAADTTTTVYDLDAACGDGFAAADVNGDGWISRTEADVAIQEHFALLDGNADGVVTREEFALCRAGSGSLTVTRTQTVLRSDDVFFAVDRDGDQKVSRDEWFDAVEARYLKIAATGQPIAVLTYRKAVSDIAASTDALDKNGDEVVSIVEVSNDALAAFHRHDRNGDGMLSPGEFTAHRTEGTATTEAAADQPSAAESLDIRWARLDTDGDGRVTFEDFRVYSEIRFQEAAAMAGSDPDVAVPVSAFTGG
jgi:Ca2+-binding EF-hand superfamily protein